MCALDAVCNSCHALLARQAVDLGVIMCKTRSLSWPTLWLARHSKVNKWRASGCACELVSFIHARPPSVPLQNCSRTRIEKGIAKDRVVAPFRSTYLNLHLSHIHWEVANVDLAAHRRSGRADSWSHSGGPGGRVALLNASGRCGDGGLCLGLGVARTRLAVAAAAGGLGVLHDLVERLVELSRHGDGGFSGVVVVVR
jgi:hypothetical protein